MDLVFEVVGVVSELPHLAQIGVGVTLCGIGMTTAWKVKRFFWIGQVGCKECKQEAGKQLRSRDKNQ